MYFGTLPQEFAILKFSEVGATWMAYPMQGISGWRALNGLVKGFVETVLEGDVSTNNKKRDSLIHSNLFLPVFFPRNNDTLD